MSSVPFTDAAFEALDVEALATPSRSFGRRGRLAVRVGLDTTMVSVATLAAVYGAGRAGSVPLSSFWALCSIALVLSLLACRGSYRECVQPHLLDDLRRALSTVSIAAMAVGTAQLLLLDVDSGGGLLREWAFVAFYLCAGRAALHWGELNAHRSGRFVKPTLIVGSGKVGGLVARRLLARPELGLKPVAFLDKEPLSPTEDTEIPVVGASWDLERVVEEHRIEQVVVAFSTAPDEVLLRLIRRCEELGVDVAFVPRFYERVPERVTVEHLGGLSLIIPRHVGTRSWHFAVKYASDRLAAFVLFLVALPIFVGAALAVWLSVGRPIFFRQTRVGRDERKFEMLKFRSMREPSPGDAVPFVLPDGLGPGGVEGADRRTRVGSILRDTSIDELPQLLNVLRGDMSMVGPRPERPEFVERFGETVYRYGERHRVKAGITGWAQVSGLRGRTSIPDRAEWDNFYIENFSLWLDLKILLLTAAAVIGGFLSRLRPA